MSFKSIMNLYVIMSELDGDITSKSIIDKLAPQVDAPSFGSHGYTCDGKQFAGAP